MRLPPQALQALGFVLGGDGDVDSLSSDEKSDGEGKTDRMSSSSSSIASSTDTQEVRSIRRLGAGGSASEGEACRVTAQGHTLFNRGHLG